MQQQSPPPTPSVVGLKVEWRGEKRRADVALPCAYADVVAAVRALFPDLPACPALLYLDSDSDWTTRRRACA
eukprot:m51a1_g13074 hypothetical protein (72) ;mRNA; f:2044-2302